MMAGRPRIWNSIEEFEADIDAFLEYSAQRELPPMKILFCKWKRKSRETLHSYCDDPAFSDIVKKMEDAAEGGLVEYALTKDKVTGPIFLLKTTYHKHYNENGSQEQASGANVTVNIVRDE